jgi:hypothetical protein
MDAVSQRAKKQRVTAAFSRFFFAVARHFLMLGVFVGLFGAKGGAFFWGGVILAK